MKEQKSGHFINVSSVYGHKLGPDASVYCATKFAVRALSEGLRQEVKPYNIRITVISPGAVATFTRRAADFWLPSKTGANALRLIKSAATR